VKFVILILLSLGISASAQGPHAGHGEAKEQKAPKATPQKRSDESRVPVNVPVNQQARVGLQVEKVAKKPVTQRLRSVGTISADERREAHVHTKINGWIERVFADFVGKAVKKGQPLFELYSPDLVSTQEEYLAARKQGDKDIASAALERLKLWGIPEKEISRLRQGVKPGRTTSFEAPVDGVVINKAAIQGMYVTPEMELYHIADLSKVWVLVTLHEFDLTTVEKGDPASVELPYDRQSRFSGAIDYVYPEVDPQTRTGRARIELPNPDGKLKPGMFADVELQKNLGPSITIPEDAVIDTGRRRIVFVRTSATKFEPREVTLGPRVAGSSVVLRGLKEGEEVVTRANFLLDAESKLQAAGQKSESPSSEHIGH
jgi:membrane fusion protein, copper/silver efflux system